MGELIHIGPAASRGKNGAPSVKRADLLRLLVGALYDLGFSRSARSVEEDSGILFSNETVKRFADSILDGDWQKSLDALPSLKMRNSASQNIIKCLLMQEKYLELLEAGEVLDALKCLRLELAPLIKDKKYTHSLAALLACAGTEELHANTGWPGVKSGARQRLLRNIENHISSSCLIPKGRLQELLGIALKAQCELFQDNNVPLDGISLFEDCDIEGPHLPKECSELLEDHKDEIWGTAFSRDGKYLATLSKDKSIKVWLVDRLTAPLLTLSGHEEPPSAIDWLYHGDKFLTCGSDCLIKLWGVQEGKCLATYKKHTQSVQAVSCLSDGDRFVSGGLDKMIYLWNSDGEILREWSGYRVNDLVATPDAQSVIAICSESMIRRFDPAQGGSGELICQQESMTSLCLAKDGQTLLVNVATQDGELQCWDISKKIMIRKYCGHQQKRFVVRAVFGGVDEAFIASGSEDSRIYIWRRKTGELLKVLSGHAGAVNAVSWNPNDPHMIASASDDHTVRIWTEKLKRR